MAEHEFLLTKKKFIADFGKKVFELFYEDLETLILTELKGPTPGRKQILKVQVVELRPRLFMVNWQESNKLTATDIEDYEKGVVYANLTTPSLSFQHLKGTLSLPR